MASRQQRTLSLGADVRVPYPAPSSTATTAVMKGNRSSDTKPELLLRSALHRRGRRFRKDYRIRLGKRSCRVDIAFPGRRVVVLVDGCFWHRCPEHGRVPTGNAEYWTAKLTRNVDRDGQTDAKLRAAGWNVVRIWEHEPLDEAVRAVERALEVAG